MLGTVLYPYVNIMGPALWDLWDLEPTVYMQEERTQTYTQIILV